MKRTISLWCMLMALYLLAILGTALAAECDNLHVIGVNLYGDGHLYIKFDGDVIVGDPGAPTCTASYIFIPADHPQRDNFYAIALTALTTGKAVMVRVNECLEGGVSPSPSQSLWPVFAIKGESPAACRMVAARHCA